MLRYIVLLCFAGLFAAYGEAKPATELQTTVNRDEINDVTYKPFGLAFKWTKSSIAAVATVFLSLFVGTIITMALFFPMNLYNLCYALGGCQNTMDQYLDKFLGIESKSINKREVGHSNMDDFLKILSVALDEYADKTLEQENLTTTTTESNVDHQIEKRSPIDYIEPILIMMSKAYEEFVDPQLKKNFKKPPSIS